MHFRSTTKRTAARLTKAGNGRNETTALATGARRQRRLTSMNLSAGGRPAFAGVSHDVESKEGVVRYNVEPRAASPDHSRQTPSTRGMARPASSSFDAPQPQLGMRIMPPSLFRSTHKQDQIGLLADAGTVCRREECLNLGRRVGAWRQEDEQREGGQGEGEL